MSEKIVAVDRALDILNYLFNKEEEAGTSEISRELDIPKSAVHRTLITLEGQNFVYQNKKTEKYWLGIKLYGMGELVKEKVSLIDIIKPYAQTLHDKVNEVINVSILELGSDGIYRSTVIYKTNNPSSVLSVNPRVGSSVEAHASSVGKSLLAFNKEISLETYKNTIKLDKYTKNTIDNWDDFLKEIEDVRKKGYALDNEEREIGLFCMGAPIFDKNNNAVAAISISGPTFRMKDSNLEDNIENLKATAREISEALKYVVI